MGLQDFFSKLFRTPEIGAEHGPPTLRRGTPIPIPNGKTDAVADVTPSTFSGARFHNGNDAFHGRKMTQQPRSNPDLAQHGRIWLESNLPRPVFGAELSGLWSETLSRPSQMPIYGGKPEMAKSLLSQTLPPGLPPLQAREKAQNAPGDALNADYTD